MIKNILTAMAVSAALFGVANAQSANSLQQSAPPTVDYQALQAQGFILFNPDAVKVKLAKAGFAIHTDQRSADGASRVFAATVHQQTFIFGFSECAPEGCLFMRGIHPIPTASAGINVTTAVANDLNGVTPLGHYVAERGGNVSLRYSIPAVPECADQCIDSHIVFFMRGTQIAHQVLKEVGNQKVARAPGDQWSDQPSFNTAAASERTLSEALINNLAVTETPFAVKTGFAGIENQLVDMTQYSGFENWQTSWGLLIPENYEEKILNDLGASD